MNTESLKRIASLKRLNQSDIAKEAGVSRQRVSQWFKNSSSHKFTSIHTQTLMKLAKALNVSVDNLCSDPFAFRPQKEELALLETQLNWDYIYPSVIDLLIACLNFEEKALARFVQIYGLTSSMQLLGKRVFYLFPNYKKNIHPARRRGLDALWIYLKSQMKN